MCVLYYALQLSWEDVILIASSSRRKTFNSLNVSTLECAWNCGISKLGSGCQQNSNNRCSMMYGSDLGFIYFYMLYPRTTKEIWQGASAKYFCPYICTYITLYIFQGKNAKYYYYHPSY